MQFSALFTTDLGEDIYNNEREPDNPSKPAEEALELLMFTVMNTSMAQLSA